MSSVRGWEEVLIPLRCGMSKPIDGLDDSPGLGAEKRAIAFCMHWEGVILGSNRFLHGMEFGG